MSLSHKFILKENSSDLKKVLNDLHNSNIYVNVTDEIVLYILDSFEWLKLNWNGERESYGLNYYGYSIFNECSITKMIEILKAWVMLFEQATNQFSLRGDYLLDEEKFAKNTFNKDAVLNNLKELLDLFTLAYEDNKIIVHDGI